MRKKDPVQAKFIDHMGNLTLFVGPNTDSISRGNRSLQNKPFEEKVAYYERSDISFTRSLTNYKNTGFGIQQIKERGTMYIQLLVQTLYRILSPHVS